MIERILYLMKINGVNAKQLTTELEISSSSITEWKKGKAKPSTEAIIKLSNYFNVSCDYILNGKDFFEIDELQKELLNLFDKMDINEKNMILERARTIIELKEKNNVELDSSEENVG